MSYRSRSFIVTTALCIALIMAPASAMAVSFQVPGSQTTLNVGGYAKLDIVYSDVSNGDNSLFNKEFGARQSIPLDNATGEAEESALVFDAQESRLWVKSSTPTDMGLMKTHIEFDFDTGSSSQVVSNSNGARIRHAYGSLGNFMAGQTWSLFMYLPSLPEINDFGGPVGTMFVRQGLVRYTVPMGGSTNLQIGLENPETFVAGAIDDGVFPDIIVRLNSGGGWGKWSAAAMVRQLKIEDDTIPFDEEVTTVSGQLAGVLNVGSKDKLKAVINYGTLGRYNSLALMQDGFINSDGEIEGLNQTAGYIGYQHFWNDKWRTNLYYGYAKADDPTELQASSQVETATSLHANLMWNASKHTRIGLEYIRGTKEQYDGEEGTLNRIMLSTRFMF